MNFYLFRSITCVLLVLVQAESFSQTQSINIRKVPIPGNRMWGISEMVMARDSNTMAIGTGQGPLYLWDCAKEELIKEIKLPGYYAGPTLEYNPKDDRFIKLQKRHFADWAPNKDRPVRTEVINVDAEQIVFRSEKVQDACWTPDGKYLVILKFDKVYFFDIQGGQGLGEEEEVDIDAINKSIQLDVVGYSVEVDPRNKLIAVTHQPTKEDLGKIPRIRNDKKAQKNALKYNHMVSFYDLASGKRIYSADDIFDIIYHLEYSRDKKYLYVYSLPHTKVQTSAAGAGATRQGYIQKVIAETGEVTRTIFPSLMENPDFKTDYGNKYMGVVTINTGKVPAPMVINVHDYESGRNLYSYSMDLRFGEAATLNRSSLVFLPDGETLIMAYGNQLGYWNFK